MLKLHILLISIAVAKRYPKTFNLLHKCFKYFMTVLDYTFWFVLEFLARYSGATPAGWRAGYTNINICVHYDSQDRGSQKMTNQRPVIVTSDQ